MVAYFGINILFSTGYVFASKIQRYVIVFRCSISALSSFAFISLLKRDLPALL